METRNSSFNPSDFIRFVEPDPHNSSPKAIAFTVKLQPNIERRWRTHCDRHGLHRMKALRDCFAAALRLSLEAAFTEASERDKAGGQDAGHGGRPPLQTTRDLTEHWQEVERERAAQEYRAAADGSDSRFGF